MKLCNETITIVNSYLDPDEGFDVYSATLVDGVSWFAEVVSTLDDKGLKAADRVIIRIPEDADFGGKAYVRPSEYGSDPDVTWTIRTGDLIVRGALDPDLELTRKALEKRGAVTVLGVTDDRRAPKAPHWKVVCS